MSNVEAVVDALVRRFQPFLVVLYGSRALVVVPDDREHNLHECRHTFASPMIAPA